MTAVGARAAGSSGPPPGDARPDPVALASSVPPAPGSFQVGVVGSETPDVVPVVQKLGARVMRAEFTPATTPEQLAPLVGRLADAGVRLQPLVGWEDGSPAPDLTPVARWAAAFGPGGTFWAHHRAAPGVAMTDIELGNENAFYAKSGSPDEPRYGELATAYGRRATDAARAVAAANPAAGVLVELESADSRRPRWIDATLAAGGPDLVRLMHAPTIHPYGPRWREKVDRDFRYLAARGVHRAFAVTEWGISSDDGVPLDDNYDFPADLRYDQAGALLSAGLDRMAGVPGEIRQVLLYQARDQRASHTDAAREHYFGLVRQDGGDKGGYTAAARAAYGRWP